ncbi:hypothetical protein MZTS_22825 [Methylorubrum zatmanii]|nr:hypothetical protein [Methylorubrum zatmanii]
MPEVNILPVPDNDRSVPNLPALIDFRSLLRLKPATGLDRSFAGTRNPNTIMRGGGNRIPFCPAVHRRATGPRVSAAIRGSS